jgi:hypothetical protein
MTHKYIVDLTADEQECLFNLIKKVSLLRAKSRCASLMCSLISSVRSCIVHVNSTVRSSVRCISISQRTADSSQARPENRALATRFGACLWRA